LLWLFNNINIISPWLLFWCSQFNLPPLNTLQPEPTAEEEEAPEEDYEEDDLPRIQAEVNALQAEFDQAVVEKHSLEMELISMNERLKAATEMVDRWDANIIWL